MDAKRFKLGLGAFALVVFALSGCASKSDPGLANGAGAGGVPGAGGDVGAGGVPGPTCDVGGGGVPGGGGAPTEADFDAEEQVVYTALLAQKYPASFYVLQTETGVEDFWWNGANPPLDALDALLANMITYHPALSSETTASFAARNATAHPVATDMNIGAPYALITDEETAQLRASLTMDRNSPRVERRGEDRDHSDGGGADERG
jgi:hypothetical protein